MSSFKKVYLTKILTTYIDANGKETKSKDTFPSGWNKKDFCESAENKVNEKNGFGHLVRCGKESGIIVLDFDKQDGSDYDPYVETCKIYPDLHKHYTVKSRRGYHVYFKYDSRIKKFEMEGVDTQTDNKLVFGENTPVMRYDGSVYSYKKINNGMITELPDVLLKMCKMHNDEHELLEFTTDINYVYDVTDDQIRDILDRLLAHPELRSFFNRYDKWLILTTVMKTMDKFNIWDEYCRMGSGYNAAENLKTWRSINIKISINFFCKLLKLPFFKYHKVVDDVTLNSRVAHTCWEVDWKYISILFQEFCDNDVIILDSKTGTGKTTCVAKNFASYHALHPEITLLSIANLRSLCDQQIITFKNNGTELYNYQDDKCNPSLLLMYSSVICINSLYQLYECDFSNKIIYIDEVFALLNSFENNHTMVHERLIINTLIRAVNECHKIVVSDAHIYNSVLLLLENRIKKDPNKVIHYINEYQKFKGVPAVRYNDENELYNKVWEKVQCEFPQTFCFAFDSLKKATEWFNYLKDEASEANRNRMILYTSATNEDMCEDWNDKIVFYSPKISTGVDINTINASEQFMYITGKSVSSITMLQMATRCRNMSQLSYYSEARSRNAMYVDYQDCVNKCLKEFHANVLGRSSCYIDKNDVMLENEDIYFNLRCENKYVKDLHMTNVCAHFEKELKKCGFVLLSAEDDIGKLAEATKEKMVARSKEIQEEKYQKIVACLDNEEKDGVDIQMQNRVELLKLNTPELVEEYRDLIENERKLEHFLNYTRLNTSEAHCNFKLNEIVNSKMLSGVEGNIWNKIKYIHMIAKICNISHDLFDISNISVVEPCDSKKVINLINAIKVLYNKRDKAKIYNADYITKMYVFMLNSCIKQLSLIKSTRSKARSETRDKYVYSINETNKAKYDKLMLIMGCNTYKYDSKNDTTAKINFLCDIDDVTTTTTDAQDTQDELYEVIA